MPSELCCLIFMLDVWSFGQSQCRTLARLQHQCQKVLLLCSERTCDTACGMPVWQIGRTHCRHKISQVVWLVVGLYVLQYGMHFLHVNQAACILRQFVDPQRRVQWYNAWSRESTKCLELILTSSGATRWADDNFSEIRPATKTRPRVGLCESAWPCQQVVSLQFTSIPFISESEPIVRRTFDLLRDGMFRSKSTVPETWLCMSKAPAPGWRTALVCA